MAIIGIYITCPNKESAQQITKRLMEKKQVACGNIFPIQSMYWWNGQQETADEFVALVKTRVAHWELVKTHVEKIHPYEVPCIIKLEMEANKAYEEWIFNETQF